MAKKSRNEHRRLQTVIGAFINEQGETANTSDNRIEPVGMRRSLRGRNALERAFHQKAIVQQEVSPSICRIWKGNKRLYERLDEGTCADLIESFKAIGQKRAAIARPVSDGSDFQFEIVSGARRHWAAAYLGRDLLIELQDLTDEEAFIQDDVDNKDHKDLSDYERALKYEEALEQYYQSKQSRLAEKIGRSRAFVSQFMAIAELRTLGEGVIVRAYPDPRWLNVTHARKYRALYNDPRAKNTLLERAEKLINGESPEETRKSGAAIFTYLTAAIGRPKSKAKKTWEVRGENGRLIMKLESKSKSKLQVEINFDVGTPIEEIVQKLKLELENCQK